MTHTNNVTNPSGDTDRVSQVRCADCGNIWWVSAQNEFQPSCCCYCGMNFRYYTDVEDVKRSLTGEELR